MIGRQLASNKNDIDENIDNSTSFAKSPYPLFNNPVPTNKKPRLSFKKNITVAVMSKNELNIALGWAKAEGWNPGKYEISPFYAADSNGFFMLSVDGEPVATLATVKYSPDYAFLGIYICTPNYRGQGYGKQLFNIVTSTVSNDQTIGLNSVMDQISNYAKSGFIASHLNTRWKGKILPAPEKNASTEEITLKSPDNISLKSLIDYDAKVFSTPRAAFLESWITMPNSHTLVAFKDNEICGYGTVSECQEGYKIAPLFANDEATAEKLYRSLGNMVGEGKDIQIDATAKNPSAVALLQRFGLTKSFDTMRMYRGKPPQAEDDKVYGLTTLELG